MENINNIKLEEMNVWAVDDWAAFGISLWQLQKSIKEDPAYISEAVDILAGIRKVLPRLNLIMRKYAADVAELVAGLSCDCIRSMAEDCQWDAKRVAQSHRAAPNLNLPEDDDEDPLDLPREWFDGLEDDD